MAYKPEDYRTNNARKVNSKRFPNGYLYILELEGFDIYKVGVSQKPKRRIRDINGVLPFETKTIYLKYFEDVYNIEEIVHSRLKNNKKRKEWFELYREDVNILMSVLNEVYAMENN